MSDGKLPLRLPLPSSPSALLKAILEENEGHVMHLLNEKRVDPNEGGFFFKFLPYEGEIERELSVAPIHLIIINEMCYLFDRFMGRIDVDINIRTGETLKPRGLTPLELALLLERKEKPLQKYFVQQLVKKGARLPAKELLKQPLDPETDLFTLKAAAHKFLELLSTWSLFRFDLTENVNQRVLINLLDFGLNINTTNAKGETLLHLSVDLIPICNTLIKYKANLSIRDNEGNTPLMAALKSVDVSLDLLKALTPRDEALHAVNLKTGDNALSLTLKSILFEDVISFMRYFFKHLIERGADIHHKLKDGKSLLHLAAVRKGSMTTFELLLRKGVKPDFTLIKQLIESQRMIPLQMLLISKYKQDLNLVKTLPQVLHLVVSRFQDQELLSLVKELVEGHDIDPNARKPGEATLVLFIIRNWRISKESKTDLFEYLFKNGLNPRALHLKEALKYEDLSVALLLLDHMKDINLKREFPQGLLYLVSTKCSLNSCCRQQQGLLLPVMKRLIVGFKYNPNYSDKSGAFLIELVRNSTETQAIDCFDYLLSLDRLDLNVTLNKETPLSIAVKREYYILSQILVENYVDINRVELRLEHVSTGFSALFECLLYFGYMFKPNFLDNIIGSQDVQDEINRFKKWFEERRREGSSPRLSKNYVRI